MLKSRSLVLTQSRRLLLTMTMSSTHSLEHVAQRLVNSQDTNALVCIAVAGGGGNAISALASTPGASSMLLEGTVAYDRRSFHNYVVPPKDFKYVSSEAAHLLSQTALSRAMRYRSSPQEQCRCVGVGASSALVQSKPGRVSRGHVVATHADGRQWECYVKLAPHNRTRLEEDRLLSCLILESIEQVNDDKHGITRVDPIMMEEDEFQQWHSPGVPPEDSVRVGAERVLLGETPAVILLPRPDKSFVAVPHVVLPNRSLVFPGSFNPPHVGHASLANAAKSAYRNDKEEDTAVLFEISLINADKPAMDSTTVSERAHKIFELENLPSNWGVLLTSVPLFAEKADILRDCITTGMCDVLIETHKLAFFFSDLTFPSRNATDLGAQRQMAFVIGTDTMVRILNPKYYGDSKDAMLEAVRDMKRHGVHFVVGGRLQQGTEDDKYVLTMWTCEM